MQLGVYVAWPCTQVPHLRVGPGYEARYGYKISFVTQSSDINPLAEINLHQFLHQDSHGSL